MVITILGKERLSESREKIYGKLVENDERPTILGSLFVGYCNFPQKGFWVKSDAFIQFKCYFLDILCIHMSIKALYNYR